MDSRPANALTSMINVDLGKWKFVINASTTLKEYPGRINRSVGPSNNPTVSPNFAVDTALSNALTQVVPTAITLPPFFFV